MEESNWIPTIVVAIIAAVPGIYAVYRQIRQDSAMAEERERQDDIKSRLELDRASWQRAGETMKRQEQKIAVLETYVDDLESRLKESDERIKRLEIDIAKYELLLEERNKAIRELERKLKDALAENDKLRKELENCKE